MYLTKSMYIDMHALYSYIQKHRRVVFISLMRLNAVLASYMREPCQVAPLDACLIHISHYAVRNLLCNAELNSI